MSEILWSGKDFTTFRAWRNCNCSVWKHNMMHLRKVGVRWNLIKFDYQLMVGPNSKPSYKCRVSAASVITSYRSPGASIHFMTVPARFNSETPTTIATYKGTEFSVNCIDVKSEILYPGQDFTTFGTRNLAVICPFWKKRIACNNPVTGYFATAYV